MVANLNWLNENLATGGDLSYNTDTAALQVADIVEQGIHLIIDLRMEHNDRDVWAAEGVSYIHLPTDDRHGHHIPALLFDDLVTAAMPLIEAGGKVLVHCHMGVNRGPSGAYAVLLEMGMDPIEAYDLIIEKRPQAALAYAMDALEAHERRHGASTKRMADVMSRLRRHENRIWTPAKRRAVNHIIRSNHQQDAADLGM